MNPVLARAFEAAEGALATFRSDEKLQSALAGCVGLVAGAFRSGNKIMACGNGGSMADAMHLCEEFTGRFRKDRRPYPALAFSDSTHLSCVANDFGFDEVFSRCVEAFGKTGDILFVLSTSGNSENLIRAAQLAQEARILVVGLLGKGGGRLLEYCDVGLVFPGATSDRIQELHMLALHALIEAVEVELGHG
jgi:D-sedoheptulose 7-phosphate isomerase